MKDLHLCNELKLASLSERAQIMKIQTFILTLTVSICSLLTLESYGQVKAEVGKAEQGRMDSLLRRHNNEMVQTQETKDNDRMANVTNERKATKAKAKEARRVAKEADTAARESKKALKKEKKAQRSRKEANQQSEKAAKARETSDEN